MKKQGRKFHVIYIPYLLLIITTRLIITEEFNPRGSLQLRLYWGVWPQDWKIDPSAD